MKRYLNKPINKSILIIFIILAILLMIVYFRLNYLIEASCFSFYDCSTKIDSYDVDKGPKRNYPLRQETNIESISIKKLEVKFIHTIHSTDFQNNQKMLGASHNVFVAKILRQISSTPLDSGIIATQFEAEIIDNIKGKIQGNAIINQQGGYKDGILNIVGINDDIEQYLLKPGATYLLATRFSESKNRYTVHSHFNARKLISPNSSLSKSQLIDLARNDPKVQALQEAYKNEILLDADIKNNNTRNSYKSLHPEGIPAEPK